MITDDTHRLRPATVAEGVTGHSHPVDDKLLLLIPADDVAAPEISIVIPALNEEAVIARFLEWCREGIEKTGVAAEILIIDSSEDRTPEIALAHGARVLRTPVRGLGQAYRDALPVIRGRYVIMGDADCTYDFREIAPFLERFRDGNEFVMGSRFAGAIEDGAMPPLHRYFGTPLTGLILNIIYGTRFTDIHCGMRGMTTDALKAMNLQSRSWEYASEIVVKSVRLGLKTAEVPVQFYKDQDGRISHHKRLGWFSPWRAGWINLRAMLIHGADFFVIKPGVLLFAIGLLTTLALTGGPIVVGGVTLSLNTMMLGSTLAIVGMQSFFLGCMAQTLYDPSGRTGARWLARFAYTRMMIVSGGLWLLGLILAYAFLDAYISLGFTAPMDLRAVNHRAVAGLLAIVLGFQTFVSTLLLHAIVAYMPTPESRDTSP